MVDIAQLAKQLKDGSLIPYIGMGIYEKTVFDDQSKVPFDSDSIILALNDGRAMAPRLMYEFSRAAMNLEQKKGRAWLEHKMGEIFSKPFARPKIYDLVALVRPQYVIDTNYDAALLECYDDVAHTLILGKSRLGAEHDRFVVFEYDAERKSYFAIEKEGINEKLPLLFKPLGCVKPQASYIISDADFVDWITEAMGGFALPPQLKEYRKGKKYLFTGVRFSRDTQRMAANEITYDLGGGCAVFAGEEAKSETKFLKNHNLERLNFAVDELETQLINALKD